MSETSTAVSSTRRSLGVAVVGLGWMGRVHAEAYARVPHHFPELSVRPVLKYAVDEVPGRAARAADQFGFERGTEDWAQVLLDPSVEVVSITLPNFLHRDAGIAFAEAGKHIWIEKPVGTSLEDATAVAAAVRTAGTKAAVGFNYRLVPAVVCARQVIASGELGEVTHARFQLLSDYAAHPQSALTWRFERERGGNGVLGDLASHGVDLAWHLLGDIGSVVADSAIFVGTRPRPTAATTGHEIAPGGAMGEVENEDYAGCLLRFISGARAMLEVSRVAIGDQNAYGFEIHGSRGSLRWDFRRMGELQVSTGTAYQDQPVRKIYVGPGQGHYGAFQPAPALSMSYDDLKVTELYGLLHALEAGTRPVATLEDAVRNAAVLEALERSAAGGRWVQLAEVMRDNDHSFGEPLETEGPRQDACL